ncbi:hypothetical protein GALMADRAFT_135468 [Galerina marginata CBS 339.88]|uniref:Mcm6 C-terminal winged-helix domain-containing protein n=1 Tax=Galerina marginata (strain CBS 339.88) TaxID=685588 RepID=A0A067TG31_GALM3|nr:hypothetical protein GALMADRAFT_135468 [Galerina marginata CBS 339.88]
MRFEDLEKPTDLKAHDIIIAIMGPSGIIDRITREGKRAGHGLKSCSKNVSGIRIGDHPKYGDRIVLIDTPGFDDTDRSDLEILIIISEWLSQLHKAQIFLSGIIYVHRISDNRMSGAHQVALRMVSELCGDKATPHVVLVSTMWDIETKEVAEIREQELAKYYWLNMIQQGASTARFENTEESAWKIIDKLLANPAERMVLQVQAELEDPRRHPKDTKAARALYVHPQTILAHPATINEKLDHQNTLEAGQLNQKDIVIALMGPSGSGKSHIIDILTERSGQRAAAMLHSSTTEVRSFRIKNYPGYKNRVVLVDTPSFDNSEVSDLDILRLINDWLAKTYEEKVLLSGIIYLHRVTDNRMSGTPYRNLRIFGELCGERAANNVFLITTMWDRLDQDLGESREQSLQKTFWKPMLDNGATIARFNNNEPTSAWDIIDSVISRRSKPIPLLLQEEIIDCNRSLKETHAGQELCENLQNLLAQQKETIQLLTEQATAESNPLLSADLIDECIAIQEQMRATLEQVRLRREL